MAGSRSSTGRVSSLSLRSARSRLRCPSVSPSTPGDWCQRQASAIISCMVERRGVQPSISPARVLPETSFTASPARLGPSTTGTSRLVIAPDCAMTSRTEKPWPVPRL